MLAFLLFVALVGAVVVCAALGGAVLVVLRREADLVIKVDRLEAEANGLQDQSNDQARRLTRRRTPIVPPQRKASA